jgi:hypothetical protein
MIRSEILFCDRNLIIYINEERIKKPRRAGPSGVFIIEYKKQVYF